MTTDRDLDQKVRTWLDEPPPGPPDRDAVYARVVDRLPETHQRRHWWPFQWNPFGARATRSAAANGPHPQGRSRIMLNATRVVAAATVLALGGTLALVAGPLGPAIEPAPPGAEQPDSDVIALVTGQAAHYTETDPGDGTVTPRAQEFRGVAIEWEVAADDPRLSGVMSVDYNVDAIFGAAGTRAMTGIQRIENDAGAWEGDFQGVGFPGTNDLHVHAVLAGSGSYEGLTAVMYLDNAANEQVMEFEAVIFPGELPAYP